MDVNRLDDSDKLLECEVKQSRIIFLFVSKEQRKVANNKWKDIFGDFRLNNLNCGDMR